ncbi:hypothetical protein J0A71_02g04780 [Encephalitozoon cuniculi]|nr:hypothetical protein J0A71_02g04780 [Encephalitozoon cuniculi]
MVKFIVCTQCYPMDYVKDVRGPWIDRNSIPDLFGTYYTIGTTKTNSTNDWAILRKTKRSNSMNLMNRCPVEL